MKKSVVLIIVAVLILAVFSASAVLAVEQKKITQPGKLSGQPLQMQPAKPGGDLVNPQPGFANLSISAEANSQCGACSNALDRLDARIFSHFSLPIYNAGQVATAAKVEFSFFDLSTGQQKTITVNTPMIEPGRSHFANIIQTPILIKKSAGVKATVTPATTGVRDLDASNNTHQWNDCPFIN